MYWPTERALRAPCLALMAAVAACGTGDRARAPTVLAVSVASSLAKPVRAALDSFAAGARVEIQQENGGSLELIRRITELGRIPDLLLLADADLMAQLVVPAHASWQANFARNRLVIAYSERSRHAAALTAATWRDVLTRPDVEVARADPDRAPVGYRTLLAWQLAARVFGDSGLPARLAARAPPRNLRASEAEVVALVQAGEVDYAWTYESTARAAGLRVLVLDARYDLGAVAESSAYAAVTIRLPGAASGDSVTVRGTPIAYALTVPRGAANAAGGARAAAFLLSPRGRRIMHAAGLDVLDAPVVLGDPPAVVRVP